MEATAGSRHRGRGNGIAQDGRRPHSRNKTWIAGDSTNRSGTSTPHHGSDGERWERGGHRGGGRGSERGGGRGLPRKSVASSPKTAGTPVILPQDEPVLETQEERDEFYRELVKARDLERKKAIAEGKMDDPLVPKRLEDAITMVGTCMDMCPRFERYRRERENNLFEWEVIPGTKRVDHQRAVKMYERAAGDKTLPSDLRPPHILKQTLDYLFHELLPREGFSPTFNFIRDRSRAVRNDFTMQHETGELAIECHDRCARFHILALHFERDREGFSIALEEQQLMNTLQSLKEFYEDQRGRYESPNELEMRVYHRLIHIRDQRERHDDISPHILDHPVFKLTTEFRLHVQRKSAPITKTSNLVVDSEAMQIFSKLANVLREQGNVVMIYLVACILERLFGKETIDDIESIRGDLSIPDIIDGVVTDADEEDDMRDELAEETQDPQVDEIEAPQPQVPSNSSWSAANGDASAFAFPSSSATPQTGSAFSNLQTASKNIFGTGSVFGASQFQTSSSVPSVFGAPATVSGLSAFAQAAQATSASLPASTSAFTSVGPSAPSSTSAPAPSLFSTSAPPQLPKAPTRSLADAPPLPDTSIPPVPASVPSPFTLPPSDTTKNIFSSPLPFGIQSKPISAPSNAPLSPTAPEFKPSVPLFTPISQVQGAEPPKPPLFAVSPAPIPNGKPTLSFTIPPSATSTSFPSTSIFSQTSAAPSTVNGGGSNLSPTTGLPRINTANLQPAPAETEKNESTGSQPLSNVPSTPTMPPPPRPQPISLPPTPTVPSAATSNPRLAFLQGSLVTTGLPSSSSSTDILSPLQLNSPTVSRQSSIQNFAGLSTPVSKRSFTFDGPSLARGHPSPLSGKSKGKAKATDEDDLVEPSEEDVAKAIKFARQGSIVKSSFAAWKSQTTERIAYAEAVRKSDDYKAKLHTTPKTNGINKRRISSISSNALVPASAEDSSTRSPVKKRARHRESRGYQAPRTDDELAKRFKENQEEHQHWWAQGSLLQVIRNHVKVKMPMGPTQIALHKTWRLWVSFNPAVDSTAIWLQKKFSVPESGNWLGDSVFSIPLVDGEDARAGSPGVIVFECTPLEEVDDELERKYRVLDDCARLRDIIKALPPKRCFVPSLLVFFWSEGPNSSPATDFLHMINKLVEDETLGSYNVFPITAATKDLDPKFSNALASMTIDVEGKLVRSLTLSGLFKFFDASLNSFASEWIESLSIHGHFNWVLYGRLVQCVIALLNTMIELIAKLLDVTPKDSLPSFPANIDDSDSAYETVIQWLISARLDDPNTTTNLQAHQDMGKLFPTRTFVDHLREIMHISTERFLGISSNSGIFHVPLSDLESSSQEWKMAIEPHQASMSQVLTLSLRRSPKRRSLSTADTESTSSKRLKLSASASTSATDSASFVSRSPTPSPLINGNGRLSLSPAPSEGAVSVSTATEGETKAPTVTIAMLRALTKNLKEKYGASSTTS